jgi:hypothetical protein
MDENLYLRMARTFGFYAVATTACIAASAGLVEAWKHADHWAAVLALAIASMLWLALASGLFLGARSPALPRLGRWVDRVLQGAPASPPR